MGWDQSVQRQDVQNFLLDFLGVDPNELLREIVESKLAELGLSFEVEEDTDTEDGDGMYNVFHPRKITLSDGRVFVETLTESVSGDDWGNEYYSFVEAGKSYEILRVDHQNDEPVITREAIPGDVPENPSISDMREHGNALTPGMGDEIADFFESQGITDVSFEPDTYCNEDCCSACGEAQAAPSKICDCAACHGNATVQEPEGLSRNE